MDYRDREEERIRLKRAIEEWNASRLDLFEITPPDENLEFHGVMRFFYQDYDEKISTKCIRVSSTATTRDVIDTLVEKFHPDMRMLSKPTLSLYEVHVAGEERNLDLKQLPLRVQLNWTKDLREGRFLLRQANAKSKPNFYQTDPEPPVGNFKRKLSKREKKELKKKEKEAKLKGITLDDSSPPKLYDNLSKTFTRTISNPEGVLRRKRQQKVDQMERYRIRPDSGGILKVYAHTVFPEANYKTLLLPYDTPAAYIVKQSLENFGHPKEKPEDFCLVRVVVPHGADPNDYIKEKGWNQEAIMDEDELPLEYMRTKRSDGKGDIMFELKKRPPDYRPRQKRKRNVFSQDRLPYFLELNLDGTDIIDYKPVRHRLQLNVTEVGSRRDPNCKGPFLELQSPEIRPRHCVIANMEGVVTLTPSRADALITVDGKQLQETTVLQHGSVIQFARSYTYRFCEPKVEDPGWEERQRTLSSSSDPQSIETTFNVTEVADTSASPDPVPAPRATAIKQYILPATLEFREPGEDAFLNAIIRETNGAHVHFKLAPTYALYLACRHRLSKTYRPNIDLTERAQRLTPFINKISDIIDTTVRENYQIAMSMAFWLANGSEFLHFLQKDLDIGIVSQDARDILDQCTQDAFRHLVRRIRFELNITLASFFDPSGEADIEKDFEDGPMKGKESDRWMTPPTRNQRRGKATVGEVMEVLTSVMTLLRRCRVNAALTIQLFSQLFHFINVFLFNRLFAPPPLPKLCSRQWGERLQRRIDRVYLWAEKQGLELAANAHLTKVNQAIKLLAMEKVSRATLEAACGQAARLNSRQLGALLEMYQPGAGETKMPREIIATMVAIQRKTNEEADMNLGRPLVLEEDPELRVPIIVAEDGYSSDIVKDIPNGLPEFLEPLVRSGMVRFNTNPMAVGTWTVYMNPRPPSPETLSSAGSVASERSTSSPVAPSMNNGQQPEKPPPQVKADAKPPPEKREPDVIIIDLDKGSSPSMGLSIVALKGPTQEKMGIYVKAVVQGGSGAKDGRIKAGDQILEVDGNNIVGLDRDEATKFLVNSGQVVKLKVAQQGAIFHGLAGVLSQPSPPLQRANKGQLQQPIPPPQAQSQLMSQMPPPKQQMPVPQPRQIGNGNSRQSPTSSDNGFGGRQSESPSNWDRREASSTMPRGMPGMPRGIPGMPALTQADKARSSPNLADDRSATLPNNQRFSATMEAESRERHSSVSIGRPAERHKMPQKGGLAHRSKSTSQLDPDNFDEDGGFSRQSQSSMNLHEPLYRGRAPPEEPPPFAGRPRDEFAMGQFEKEPYRRQPQPREEPHPTPQPRVRPSGPQVGVTPRQYQSPLAKAPQQRMPQQGFRTNGPSNQTGMSAAEQLRIGAPDGHLRMTVPINQSRMNNPNQQSRMNGPNEPPRMNGPNEQSRINGPSHQNRMQGPNAKASGPQRSVQFSIQPQNYEQPRPTPSKETHFPAVEAQYEERRTVEPELRSSPLYQQQSRPVQHNPPQDDHRSLNVQHRAQNNIVNNPRARQPPNGPSVHQQHGERQHEDMPEYLPPPPPLPNNYEVPFTDLPPPPADLTAPPPDLQGFPDDLPPPPPLPEAREWREDMDDYQRMFEEQEKQLERELQLLQEADNDLDGTMPEVTAAPGTDNIPAYASLPRQGRTHQPSTPLGDQPQPQRQPSNGPIPVASPVAPDRASSVTEVSNGPKPMSVTNLMAPADNSDSISPSAWARDAKERKEEWYEGEMMRKNVLEIDVLRRSPNRTAQQEERLRKLIMEVEFQKRVDEARREEAESNEEDEVTRATVKVRMVQMVDDQSENSLKQMLTMPPPPPSSQGQETSDYADKQALRLQQLQQERMRQQQQPTQQQPMMSQPPPPPIGPNEKARQLEEERRRRQQQEDARRRQQQQDEILQRQEEEMQRRHEQQRLEYARREAQIEQERLRLEQQLNLQNGPGNTGRESSVNNGPLQATVGVGYIQGPDRNRTTAAPVSNGNAYNGYHQARPFVGTSSQSAVRKVPPPIVAKKPSLAPKPALKLVMPNHTKTTDNHNSYHHAQSPTGAGDGPQVLVTPKNTQQLNTYRTGDTPGVIGAQEVYMNPYERKIMGQRMQKQEPSASPGGPPLSFKDKLKAFSEDASPVARPKTSRWEQKFLAENPDVLQS